MSVRPRVPLQVIPERREHMAARPDHLQEVLREGSARARRVASETLAEVKAAVGVA
jgi:tryptophanyl-tRNA synthetase